MSSDLKSETTTVNKLDYMTCEQLLIKAEDYSGKAVIVQAFCWGSSPSIDGQEILMSLDDQKLEGMQQSHVLVHFSKDQERELLDIEENHRVKLNATVGAYEYGALRLINPQLIKTKK